ncbi:MAG: hypothetical protein U1D33_00160, partial [bacterium]|nr:hypothetical protein [bacterium]
MTTRDHWTILPSEKAAERTRRTAFAQSGRSVLLGESVFSLQHFLNRLSASPKNLLKRNLQKHLVACCLKEHPLKYFEKQRHLPHLAAIFTTAIRQLKQWDLQPNGLKERLKESGSLKEYDLLTAYQRYEELKEKLGCIDGEDQYACALENLKNPENPLRNIISLSFENFDEKPAALKKLLNAITLHHPKTKVDFKMIHNPQSTSHAALFSLPTPHQEAHWFVEQLKETNGIGILMSGSAKYYEFIWKNLKPMGLTEGPFPFSNWNERPEGRHILEQAAHLNIPSGTLTEFLLKLTQKIPDKNPLREHLESFLFQEHILSLGKLSQPEWLLWLHEALTEKPKRSVPESL